jgi:hypothetical protein
MEMLRSHWLASAAIILLSVSPAFAQDTQKPSGEPAFPSGQVQEMPATDLPSRPEVHETPPNMALIGSTDPIQPSNYWLGVVCATMSPELRAQLGLPEKQGVLVAGVSKDSPAMKAGFAQYDVLLRAGGKPLTEPRDLVVAIKAAKETKLKIDLLRNGKPKTIEVAPAKRPAEIGSLPFAGDQADWDTVQRWLEQMAPQGQPGVTPPGGRYQFRYFHPGAIVPNNVLFRRPLPKNMSITIIREGDQPAKIAVKRDSQKWEITEKELDKLPPDVRPHVDAMLGRNIFGIVGGPYSPSPSMPTTRPPLGGAYTVPMIPPPSAPGSFEARIEKRFDEMNARMDAMMKVLEQMGQTHLPNPTTPEHQKTK